MQNYKKQSGAFKMGWEGSIRYFARGIF